MRISIDWNEVDWPLVFFLGAIGLLIFFLIALPPKPNLYDKSDILATEVRQIHDELRLLSTQVAGDRR